MLNKDKSNLKNLKTYFMFQNLIWDHKKKNYTEKIQKLSTIIYDDHLPNWDTLLKVCLAKQYI